MKFTTDRPYADPEKAARKLVEIANSVEVVQDGRIHIEKINGPFLYREKGTPAEYKAGLDLAIERGWLVMHRVRNLREIHPSRRGVVRLMKCTVCEDTGWVCENHSETPWDGEHACKCGGAGMPCPKCNPSDLDNLPRPPISSHHSVEQ